MLPLPWLSCWRVCSALQLACQAPPIARPLQLRGPPHLVGRARHTACCQAHGLLPGCQQVHSAQHMLYPPAAPGLPGQTGSWGGCPWGGCPAPAARVRGTKRTQRTQHTVGQQGRVLRQGGRLDLSSSACHKQGGRLWAQRQAYRASHLHHVGRQLAALPKHLSHRLNLVLAGHLQQ